ncbi:MAG TPA: hypothetical protein VHC04_13310 [Rhodopila sp.]|nr:hypothetical protein [Rhodopila sp.]
MARRDAEGQSGLAAVMTGLALPADAVSVRQVRARGVPEPVLRRQLALVAAPEVKRFVFIRRVRLRATPQSIATAMRTALATLADSDRPDVLTYPDVPALVVACAKAALSGGLGGWHWRMLGLSPVASAGEAVAALLVQHPLEAGSAVAALAEAGLLGAVWRRMPDAAARDLARALIAATGCSPPPWPVEPLAPPPASAGAIPDAAVAFWRAALSPLPPAHPAVLVAGILAVLRWSPRVLRSVGDPAWPALIAHIAPARQALPAPRRDAAEAVTGSEPRPDPQPAAWAGGAITDDRGADAPRGDRFATHWAGLLFLINALNRLDVEAILAAIGGQPPSTRPPSAWLLLHALGLAHGMPAQEPLARFLSEQAPDMVDRDAAGSDLVAGLMARIEALYRPAGPWPLPLRQPGWLTATETHLELHLATTTVDLAVRLAGLDLNPGWVPWLGRVVHFHYDAVPIHASAVITQGGRIGGGTMSS